MKKCVFIGSYDKTDMLLYIGKILTVLNKKVLIVDTTVLKKSRYIVPTMVQEKMYITNYEGIDVAIGFENINILQKYYEKVIGQQFNYDIILFDIDRAIIYKQFKITAEDRHYLVTSFDVYNLKRAIQILPYIEKDAIVTKVYYTKRMLRQEDKYLEYLSSKIKVNWDKQNIVYFPFETDDLDAIYTNQRTGRIQMKGLSKAYISSILYLAEEISGESNSNVKRALRKVVI